MARAAETANPERLPPREPARSTASGADDRPGTDRRSLLGRLWEKLNAVDVDRLSAGVAFYTILSLAPLLILVVAVGSWWVGADATRQYLSMQIADLIGREGGELVGRLVSGGDAPRTLNNWGAWAGMAVTAIGATASFAELQYALNRIFGALPRATLAALLRARALSFGLVLGTGFLLAASFVLSAGLTLLVDRGAENAAVRAGAVVNELVGVAVITLAFAALLRVLPDRPPRGRRLWIGAAASAALFVGGKYLISWYVTRFALDSAYGAAGAIVVVMIWIYFSTATFLAGAVLASVLPSSEDRRDRNATAEGIRPIRA